LYHHVPLHAAEGAAHSLGGGDAVGVALRGFADGKAQAAAAHQAGFFLVAAVAFAAAILRGGEGDVATGVEGGGQVAGDAAAGDGQVFAGADADGLAG